MKTRLILTTIAITLLALATPAAPARIEVTLSISPDTTLPALSVPLQLRVRNGAKALHLGPSVRVWLTSPDGQSFFADWGEGVDSGELEFGSKEEDDGSFTLPANASIDLAVPAADLSRPSWALDPRLLALPGEWTLQVHLYSDDLAEPVAASNPVKLTIETPTGADVPIWEALQRRESWGAAEKVFAERPESRYFPYLSTLVARHETMEKVAIIAGAMEKHPASPVVASLRYALASYYGLEADRVFFEERDLEKASALAEKGRAELTALGNGRDAWSRLKGNERLADFPSRAYFVDLQRLQREKGNRKP